MSHERILVAVDDSPAGLDAVRAAIGFAITAGGRVRAVTVVRDEVAIGELADGAGGAAARLAAAARALLDWVEGVAADAGVGCEVSIRTGEPFRCILDEASAWGADVIVMGRSDRRGPSSAYLGSETAHVLEFAERPVLVVPHVEPATAGQRDDPRSR